PINAAFSQKHLLLSLVEAELETAGTGIANEDFHRIVRVMAPRGSRTLPPGQAVCGPSVDGRDIGAGIECDSDEVFEVQDRGASLRQPEVDRGRGEQHAQPMKPFRFQWYLDLNRQKYLIPAGHFHFHEDYGQLACPFRAPASLQPRRVVHLASFSEFVLGQFDHIQDVGGMFPEREIFGDEVNAVDPRSDEGRQGVIAGNCNDVAGEDASGLNSLQYPRYQGRIVLKKSLDRPFASMNSNFHVVHFLLSFR